MNAEARGEGGAMPGAGAGPGAAVRPWWRRPVNSDFFTGVWLLWAVAMWVLMWYDTDSRWYGEAASAALLLPLLLGYGGARLWAGRGRWFGPVAWAWGLVMMVPLAMFLEEHFARFLMPLALVGALVLLLWVLQCAVLGLAALAKPASSAGTATQGEPIAEPASTAQAAQNAMNPGGCHER